MTTVVIAILVFVFFIAVMLLLNAPSIYNDLLQKGGMQEIVGPNSELVGRRVKISSIDSEGVRVEIYGSPWKAKILSDRQPTVGEWVVVKKVDGLTVEVEQDA